MIPVSRPSTGSEELASIKKVLESGWLGMGSTTYVFEEEVKKFIGSKHVIAVNTGTSALHIALDAFGIGPGDEVLVPSITYVASVQAIIATGAIPVFCESQEADLLIDVEDVKQKITKRTKAVMPVHYCGQSCDMDTLLSLAEMNDFWVIEDAAHAFGSTYKGRKIGSFGHATCFSFDPIKVITCGEGGAVSLQNDEKAELIRRKRILGIDKDTLHRYSNARSWYYEITTNGYRYHMPNFCAAIGLAQLQKIETFIQKRQEICRLYDSSFVNLGTISPLRVNYDEVAPFMYIVRVLNGRRDAFIHSLKEKGVDTGIHYIPNHLHPFFKNYVHESLDRSTRIGEQIVTLPLYYDMTEGDIKTVIEAVLEFEKSYEGEVNENSHSNP